MISHRRANPLSALLFVAGLAASSNASAAIGLEAFEFTGTCTDCLDAGSPQIHAKLFVIKGSGPTLSTENFWRFS